MFRALLIAYVLGGFTFIPLVLFGILAIAIYTSTPVSDSDRTQPYKQKLEDSNGSESKKVEKEKDAKTIPDTSPRLLQGWLTARRTFDEIPTEGSYVNQVVRSFLDARSKDPKRTRPKDQYYAVLKGTVLFLYEDDLMSECWAAIQLASYDVAIHPPGCPDGEIFAKRNAIMLRVKPAEADAQAATVPSITKEMTLGDATSLTAGEEADVPNKGILNAVEKSDADHDAAAQDIGREAAFDQSRPWFLFVKPNTHMEDWYLALLQRSYHPLAASVFETLTDVYSISDMQVLVSNLDSQPDPIPMRWLNALLGRLFFGVYRTAAVEQFIIARLMRKLAKVKWPSFLTDIKVREVNVGSTAPTFSKPMLKQLTKEGEASVEMGFQYKGEVRLTVEATAIINLGPRFKTYTVKLVLAVVLKEIQGNLLVRVKSPPSNRLWYAFTTMPKLVLEVEPVVSDRQIKWSMILNPIESILKDIITDSIVLPNMDDIPFFNTQPYQVRGGIFADAARKPASTADTSKKGLEIPADPTFKRSKSTEDVAESSENALERKFTDAVGRPETTASLPAITLEEPTKALPETSAPSSKRNSWFNPLNVPSRPATIKAEGSNSTPVIQEKQEVSDEPRGRLRRESITSPDIPRTSPSGSPSRAPNYPADTEEAPIDPPVKPKEDTPDIPASGSEFSAASTPLPSSQSLPRVRSPSLSHQATRSADFGSNPFSRPESEESRPGTSSRASTLLASWRAKAADKETLAATARQTMKKWGFGKKSDLAGEIVGPFNASFSRRGKSVSSSQKQTYEEMRAHVEERRQGAERRRFDPMESNAHVLYDEPDSSTISSIQIQTPPTETNGTIGRERAPSVATTRSNASSFTGGISLPNGADPGASPSNGNARLAASPSSPGRYISPSRPKTTTEVATPDSSPHLTASLGSPLDLSSSRPKSTPLHAAQPSSAPKMSIPGIHASHRGEVQALGSSPLPPTPSGSPMSPASTLPQKLPSIQNVYKMFGGRSSRQPSAISGDGPAAATGSTPGLRAGPGPDEAEPIYSSPLLSTPDLTEPKKQSLASLPSTTEVETISTRPAFIPIRKSSADDRDAQGDAIPDHPAEVAPVTVPSSAKPPTVTAPQTETQAQVQSPSKVRPESEYPVSAGRDFGVPLDENSLRMLGKNLSVDHVASAVLAQEIEASLPTSIASISGPAESAGTPPEVGHEAPWVPPPNDS